MAYLKPIFAGLCASAITYLCFLTWIHMKATSRLEGQVIQPNEATEQLKVVYSISRPVHCRLRFMPGERPWELKLPN